MTLSGMCSEKPINFLIEIQQHIVSQVQSRKDYACAVKQAF